MIVINVWTRSSIKTTMTVSQDGSGDFTTVQAAIDSVPSGNHVMTEIYIRDGMYKEVVTVPSDKPFITLIGESSTGTILTYDNFSGKEKPDGGTYGTSGSASVFVYADDFTAKILTIENSFDRSSTDTNNKQAVALRIAAERGYFENVRFIGNQDTLYTYSGSQYFYDCYMEGDIDFIFGGAAAVFEKCEIVSLDLKSLDNGYVTAASTMITQHYGFLFIHCRFTSDAAPGTVWLGRPWHPSGNPDAIGSVVIRECYLGAHFRAEGWTDMSGFKASDARFYEYKNEGPGAIRSETRRQLTDEQAQQFIADHMLDGWNPRKD
jgi:pectin methylesterase-like acyl-CoA thioesterase